MKFPDFKKEKSIFRKGYDVAAGIDEAGRGPLAGPVTAAAVAFGPVQPGIKNARSKFNYNKLKDSKKLSPQRREEWYGLLVHDPRIRWAAASIGPGKIDKMNVARAANLAAARAAKKLDLKSREKVYFLLDGSLSLPGRIDQETIIRGDEKVWSIAAASVIAKVTRDRIMKRAARKYPAYRFEIHKGYGTRIHYRMLKKFGPSKIHRKTFLKKLVIAPLGQACL